MLHSDFGSILTHIEGFLFRRDNYRNVVTKVQLRGSGAGHRPKYLSQERTVNTAQEARLMSFVDVEPSSPSKRPWPCVPMQMTSYSPADA